MPETTATHEPGRTAYEARFAGFTLGPRGVAPAWEQLTSADRAMWRIVEEAVALHGYRYGGAPNAPQVEAAGLDDAVALFRRTLPRWTAYSIQLHSRGRMTRFVVEISRLQYDLTEELYCAQGPTAVEAMRNVIASVPVASRQSKAPPAEGRAD